MGIITKLFGGEKPADAPPQTLDEFMVAFPDIGAKLEALDAETRALRDEQGATVNGFVPRQARVAELEMKRALNEANKVDNSYIDRDLRVEREALAQAQKRATALIAKANAPKTLARDARKYIVQQLIPAGGVVNRITTKLPEGVRADDLCAEATADRGVELDSRADVADRLLPKEETLQAALRLLPSPQAPLRVWLDNKGRPRITWASEVIDAEPRYISQSEPPQATDARAIAMWVDPDRVRLEVERQVEALYIDNPPVATTAEKRKLLAEIDARILDAERDVAEACWASRRDGGTPIAWRADLDVRALLGIDGPTPHRPRD
jgi:hypothetical protein